MFTAVSDSHIKSTHQCRHCAARCVLHRVWYPDTAFPLHRPPARLRRYITCCQSGADRSQHPVDAQSVGNRCVKAPAHHKDRGPAAIPFKAKPKVISPPAGVAATIGNPRKRCLPLPWAAHSSPSIPTAFPQSIPTARQAFRRPLPPLTPCPPRVHHRALVAAWLRSGVASCPPRADATRPWRRARVHATARRSVSPRPSLGSPCVHGECEG